MTRGWFPSWRSRRWSGLGLGRPPGCWVAGHALFLCLSLLWAGARTRQLPAWSMSGRSRCSENLHPQAGRQARTQQHLYQDTKAPQRGGQKLTIRGHTLGAMYKHQPGIHRPALTVGSLARWPSSLGLCSVLCSGLCRTVFEVPRADSWASGMCSVYTVVFREPTQGWPDPPNPACLLIV